MCHFTLSQAGKWALGLLSVALILVTIGLTCSIFILRATTPKFNQEHKIVNRNLLKSGEESLAERGRMWIEEVASSQDQVMDPKTIGIDVIYTPWSPWSGCKKKCKQVRRRYCTVPTICGSNVLKEERPCQKGRCQKKLNFHIVKRRKLSRRARGMLKFNRAFYTRWSRWSTCSTTCKTSRTRSCKFSMVCGTSTIHEEAYCYTDGSKCEQWYKEGKSLRHADKYNENDVLDTPTSDITHSPDMKGHAVQDQCGVQQMSGPFSNPPWALRIIGGRESSRGNWPWQVAILNKYREVFCGGTIVAPGWVLTAAHCIRKHLFVRLGEHDLVVKEGSEIEHLVEKVVQHPDYNPDTVDNDVALLRISTSEDDDLFGDSIFGLGYNKKRNGRRSKHSKKNSIGSFSPACLPEQDEELPTNAHCTIVGWGKEKNSHVYGTDVLHEAEIPIVPKEECENVYKDYYISKNMFCAGYKGGRIDSCAGDSGGPLLCKKDGRWTIFGITSFGEGCGQQGKYGIYAKVPNYTNWIRSVVSRVY